MTREHYLAQLKALDDGVANLGRLVIDAIENSIAALEGLDVARAKELIAADSDIDRARRQIEEQAYHVLATQQPTAIDLRLVTGSSTVASELERIGDYCTGIAKLTLTMAGEPVAEVNPQIRAMSTTTLGLLETALRAFAQRDVVAAAETWKRDDEVDEMYQEFFRFQIDEMVNHRRNVRPGTYMLWVAHNIERMADRVTNIAETIAFIVTADITSWRKSIEAASVPPSF